MKFFNELSFATKIISITALLSAIFLGVSFLYVVVSVKAELTETTINILETEVENKREKMESSTRSIRDTVLSLSGTPPFQGIIRAQLGDGYDEKETSTLEQWEKRLASIFASEIEVTGLYDQLRYIDETGQEIVRVDYINNSPVRIPRDLLQNKKDRDYFIETSELAPKQVYVSHVGLNKEGNPPEIIYPYKPVIRYAVPVFDENNGERKGIIIANILLDNLIEENYFQSNVIGEVYITGSKGHFFVHPDEDKKWGDVNDLDTGISLFTEFSDVGYSEIEDRSGSFTRGGYIFVYSRVLPDSSDLSRAWIILERIPTATIFGPVDIIVRNAMLIGLGSFIILFFSFLFFIRYLLSPLKELSLAAEDIGKGDLNQKVHIRSKDEIGQLATVFNTMASQLRGLYENLEEKVSDRTRDLTNEREKLNTILYGIGDGVFVIDKEQKITMFNQVSSDISGFSAKEVLGKVYGDVLKFVFEKDGKINNKFIKDVFRTGETQEMGGKTELIKKDGSKIAVADSAAPLKNNDGEITGAVIVFRDVSKEREVDKAKTEFVSLASHQLRTPLTAINWYTEALLSGDTGKLNEEQYDFLKEIQKGNIRMVDLIDALLNVSRLEMGTFLVEPEPSDIVEIAEIIIKELEPKIKEKNIKFTKEYDKDLPTMNLDKKLTLIIFQNLLSNAVKYTLDGGSVSLKVTKDAGRMEIKVTDSGIGIPELEQDKIFTKLYRADNVRKTDTDGTGLGMYIVKSILREAGGEIHFDSEENKGTTFYVTLPLSGMKKKIGTKSLD